MKKAFTLIELLVVVLIIGVLAAIAMPQYQKAVEKSKATQAFVLLKSINDAFEAYKLANGTYPTSFSDLDIQSPWTGTEKQIQWSNIKDTISNEDWSLQIEKGNTWLNVYISRISGPYAGAGFYIPFQNYGDRNNKILCNEFIKASVYSHHLKTSGSYCVKIMNGQEFSDGDTNRNSYTINF